MPKDQPTAIQRLDYRPPDYRIETVELQFDLEPQTTRVKARLSLKADYDRSAGVRTLVLAGDALEPVAVALDGRVLDSGAYTVADKSLTITAPPAAFTLDIETAIHPAANTQLSGLYV